MSRTVQVLVFFSILISIIAGLHYYFWIRLVRDTALAAPWRTVATVAIIALAVLLPAAMLGARTVSPELAPYLAFPAFVWMGAAFLLFVLLVGTDVVRLGAWLVARVRGDGGWPVDPERRVFFARLLGAAVGLATAGLSALAIRNALGAPKIERLQIPIAKLPPGADGLKIVQLTDIHVGPTIGRELMDDLVRRTNALAPDVVAITGDLVDGSVADLGEAVSALAGLRARHGVYFVTGNHEYYSGAGEWVAFLGTLGVRVLRNERVTIGAGDAAFDLAGVDDWNAAGNGHGRDLPRALAGRDEARALVLLAHQPRQIAQAARAGVDLQLSGHTHGGQIWPFTYLVYLQQPHVAGLVRAGTTWLYVSKGSGYWGPPMRLAVPSEITEITLRSRGGGAGAV